MKFVPDFHHVDLALAKIQYKFHGLRQIKKPFNLSERKKVMISIEKSETNKKRELEI